MKLILLVVYLVFLLIAFSNELMDGTWAIVATIGVFALLNDARKALGAPTWRESHRRVKRRPYSD